MKRWTVVLAFRDQTPALWLADVDALGPEEAAYVACEAAADDGRWLGGLVDVAVLEGGCDALASSSAAIVHEVVSEHLEVS